jgi:hypothetical protein
MDSIAVAPVSPRMPFKEEVTCEVTASRPKNRPATAMTMTMIGPRENTE